MDHDDPGHATEVGLLRAAWISIYNEEITMQSNFLWISRGVTLMALGMLVATPVFADKPAWAGGGKKQEDRDERGGGKHSDRGDRHFDDRRQVLVREYYVREHSSGRCPPGLAKKNNGCMPPGQAKKWHKGRPLPRDVIFHDLPPRLVVELGAPPSGHRFVRVASDILLIAIGTGMVVDAINDLGRM